MAGAQHVINYYDKHTANKIRDYINGNARVEAAWKRILQWAPAKPARILEIGCGVGYICARMAELWQEAEIVGVDLSPESIKNAKQMFPVDQITFIDGYFDDPRVTGEFDLIVMMDVYEHIGKDERSRLHQWIGKRFSQKGRIVLSFPLPEYQTYCREKFPDKMQPVDEDVFCSDMMKLADESGAKLIFYKKISVWRYQDYFLNDYAHAVVSKDITLYNPSIDYSESLILNPTERNMDKYILRQNLLNSLEEASIAAEGAWLDIGCGALPYKPLLTANGKINKFISIGNKSQNTNGLRSFSLWEENRLPFDNCEFDFASLINSPEFLSRQETILREAERTLKPGGKFFMYYTYFLPLTSPFNHVYENPLSELEKNLIASGFDSISIKPAGGYDLTLGATFGYWLRQKQMPEELRKRYLNQFYPFILQLAASDEKISNLSEDSPLIGLSATAFCKKKSNGNGIVKKHDTLQLPIFEDVKGEKPVLAVFMPHVGLVPETFTKIQTLNILPGNTVIVTNKVYDDSWVKCPMLVAPSADCPAKYSPQVEEAVVDFLKKNKVTHILNQYGCLNSEIAELNVRRLNLKLYIHFHGYDASSKLKEPATVEYYKWLGRNATGIISVSHPQAMRLSSIGIPSDRIRVIHLGIDPSEIPLANPLNEPFRLLSVMRLVPKKSPVNLLKSFLLARRFAPKITLDIIGGGPLRGEVEEFIKNNNLSDCVKLHGAKPFEYVASYLASASAFALHSIVDPVTGDREGLPVSIMEASAAGLPIISTYHEGIPEAVEHGVTGLLVNEGDIEAMAEAIVRLAGNPALRKQMGDAARAKILNEFTLERMIRDFRDYMDITGFLEPNDKLIVQNEDMPKDFKVDEPIEKFENAIIDDEKFDDGEVITNERQTNQIEDLDTLFDMLKQNPMDKSVIVKLADLLIAEKEYVVAAEILNGYFTINPDDEEIADKLAYVEFLAEDNEEQIETEIPSILKEEFENIEIDDKISVINEPILAPIAFENEAPRKKLKFMQVLTFYPTALDLLYSKKQELASKPYPVQINELIRDGFYAAHILTEALSEKDYETKLVVANCQQAQLMWLAESGINPNIINNWFYDIVRLQIEEFQPDVLYCFDSMYFDSRFLRTVQHKPAVVAGWRAANIPEGTDWSDFDILFSNLDGLREMALKLGAKSTIDYSPGFPEWIWRDVKNIQPDHDVVFCGMWSLGQHWSRNEYLTEIARNSSVNPQYSCLYHLSGDVNTIHPEAARYNKGILYGVEMHRALRQGRIAFDARGYVGFGKGVFAESGIDLSKSHTATMRMFEATGTNVFLLTEHGDNLSRFFEIGREIETYRDKKELIDKIRYYLSHDYEREEIARRGFERCMAEHSLSVRAAQFDKYIRDEYNRKTLTRQSTPIIKSEHMKKDVQIQNNIEASKQFSLASNLMNKGSYKESLVILTDLSRIFPKNTDYLYGKAYSLFKLNNFQEAGKALTEVLKISPKHRYANILLREINSAKDNITQAEITVIPQKPIEYNPVRNLESEESREIKDLLDQAEYALSVKDPNAAVNILDYLHSRKVKSERLDILTEAAFAEIDRQVNEINEVIGNLDGIEEISVNNRAENSETIKVEASSPVFIDKTDIKVTAIVSAYNSEKYMAGCLEDLTSQTLFEKKMLEIAVIDSASQENESNIVTDWQQKYGNDLIRLVRTPNRESIYRAWNRGIELSRGKYLTNSNTDDRHRKDALEIMASALDSYPEYGLVYADSLLTTIENETFNNTFSGRRYDWPDFTLGVGLAASIFGPQPMWRSDVHNLAGMFNPDLKVAGDFDMFIRIAHKFGAVHLRETLGLFLMRDDSLSGLQNQESTVHEIFDVMRIYRNEIPLDNIYPALKNYQDVPVAIASCLFDLGNLCALSPYFDIDTALKYWEAAAAVPNLGKELSAMLRKMLLNNSAPLLYFIKQKERAKDLLNKVIDLKDARLNLEKMENLDLEENSSFLPVEFSYSQLEHNALLESRRTSGLQLLDDGGFTFSPLHEMKFWDVYGGTNGIACHSDELERAKSMKPRISLYVPNNKNFSDNKIIDIRKDTKANKNLAQPALPLGNGLHKPRLLFTMFGWHEDGGGTILPRSIAKRLAARGWDVSVFYAGMNHPENDTPYFLEKKDEDGVRLFGLFNRAANFIDVENPLREIYDAQAVAAFNQVLNEVKPEIVHFQNFLGLSFGIADSAKKTGAKLLYTPHNYHLTDPALYMFRNDLKSWGSADFMENSELPARFPGKINEYKERITAARDLLNSKIDITLAISTRVKQILGEFAGDYSKIAVVHQIPESVESIQKSKQILRRVQKPLRLGFLGSAIPHKGVHKIVQAAQYFSREDVLFKIYGNYNSSYKNMLEELDKRKSVEWLGAYDSEQLQAISSRLDAVVVPSIWEEGAGLVIMESFAMGHPVIGAKIGGIPDFITDNENGFLYNHESESELAMVIQKLIDNPTIIETMQSKCSLPYGFNDFISHLEFIYNDIIKQGNLQAERYNLIFKNVSGILS